MDSQRAFFRKRIKIAPVLNVDYNLVCAYVNWKKRYFNNYLHEMKIK